MFKSWLQVLAAWYAALKGLPRALVTVLPKTLWKFWRHLCRCIHAWVCRIWIWLRKRCEGKGVPPRTPPSRTPSIPISHPAYKRPDPLIYDQYYLMSLGHAFTWQNPDIKIKHNGTPVASAYDLAPGTTYEVVARIWNSSSDAVVSGLPVTFSYLSFGVQTQSHLIGQTVVDLGVKGSKHCPAFATMLWTTPSVPGHYCIQVSFSWLDDYNPFNNLGQENTQVVQAASPAQFSFDLGNPSRDRRVFRFEFDTYALPLPPPCDAGGSRMGKTVGAQRGNSTPNVAALHNRANFLLPPDWTIAFEPPFPVVAPGDEQPVTVTVTPPDSFHGTLPVNIHAFAGNQLVGGVTVLVNRA